MVSKTQWSTRFFSFKETICLILASQTVSRMRQITTTVLMSRLIARKVKLKVFHRSLRQKLTSPSSPMASSSRRDALIFTNSFIQWLTY